MVVSEDYDKQLKSVSPLTSGTASTRKAGGRQDTAAETPEGTYVSLQTGYQYWLNRLL